MIGFVIGFIVGGGFGFVVSCILIASKIDDNDR